MRLQLLDGSSLGLIIAKFVLIAASQAIDYIVLGVALASVVIEVLAWKFVLTRTKPVYEVYEPEGDIDGPSLAYRPVDYASSANIR